MKDYHLAWPPEALAEARRRDPDAFTSSDTSAEAFSKRYRREALHVSLTQPPSPDLQGRE